MNFQPILDISKKGKEVNADVLSITQYSQKKL